MLNETFAETPELAVRYRLSALTAASDRAAGTVLAGSIVRHKALLRKLLDWMRPRSATLAHEIILRASPAGT
jgi:hypothetical protein